MTDVENSKHTSQQRLLTVTEACDVLRISRWHIYQLINSRRLKTIRIDRRRLVAPDDLDAFIADLRAEGGDDGR